MEFAELPTSGLIVGGLKNAPPSLRLAPGRVEGVYPVSAEPSVKGLRLASSTRSMSAGGRQITPSWMSVKTWIIGKPESKNDGNDDNGSSLHKHYSVLQSYPTTTTVVSIWCGAALFVRARRSKSLAMLRV